MSHPRQDLWRLTGCGSVGSAFAAGHLEICLCVGALADFMKSNPTGKKVCDRLGEDKAHDYFSNLVSRSLLNFRIRAIPNLARPLQIQNQNNSKRCQYPAHASPMCSIGSPCSFTCKNGYTAFPNQSPTQCKCNPPLTECNGVCGSFPRGCGSKGFSRRKNDIPACSSGKTMCGSPNGGKGFDCVNTIGDSESCKWFVLRMRIAMLRTRFLGGGCMVASPFGNNVADGKNCRNIPHVKDVDCNDGSCVVTSCKDGYEPSSTKDGCVSR